LAAGPVRSQWPRLMPTFSRPATGMCSPSVSASASAAKGRVPGKAALAGRQAYWAGFRSVLTSDSVHCASASSNRASDASLSLHLKSMIGTKCRQQHRPPGSASHMSGQLSTLQGGWLAGWQAGRLAGRQARQAGKQTSLPAHPTHSPLLLPRLPERLDEVCDV